MGRRRAMPLPVAASASRCPTEFRRPRPASIALLPGLDHAARPVAPPGGCPVGAAGGRPVPQFPPSRVRYFSNQASTFAIFAINWLGRRLMLWKAPGSRTTPVSIPRNLSAWNNW